MLETEVKGIKLKFRKPDRAVIQEVFDEDVYHISEIPEESLVIDIGAHIGTFALRCANERASTVYAYEPCHANYRLLTQNIKANNLRSKIRTFQVAVGRYCGARRFFFCHKGPDASSFYEDNTDFKTREYTVMSTNLRRIFQDNQISECDVLKFDCEMAEKEIFVQEFIPFFRRVDYVMLEWHDYDGHAYADYLSKLGFSTLLAGCGLPQPAYDPTFARGMLYAKRIKRLKYHA